MKNLSISGAVIAAAAVVSAPAVAWEPTKSVEIVVAAGAGGASDQMARMMQAAIQKNNLMKQPVIVTLKGGASGAEALMYMKSSDGDPNKVLLAYSLIYMLPLSAKIPFNWRDLTPVAVIALDEFVLWDEHQTPYKTVKEFIDAAKAANPPFKMGGTGSKREDHILTVFMEKKTGAKFLYLPYKSGGEAATQLVGNHTAVERQQPVGEPRSLARRPGARALRLRQGAHRLQGQGHRQASPGTTSRPARSKGWTCSTRCCARSFLPGKVPAEQTAFYVDLLKKIIADAGVQRLHGEAGAQARVSHRQGHAEVPRRGRQAQFEPDERSRLRRAVMHRMATGQRSSLAVSC